MKKSFISILFILLFIVGCASPTEERVVIYESEKDSKSVMLAENQTEKPEGTIKEDKNEDESNTNEKNSNNNENKSNGKFNVINDDNDSLVQYLKKPMGITVDNKGLIYLVDQDRNEIFIFTPDGNLLKQWGSFGTFIGEFKEPKYIFYKDGKIYIADTWNQRIQIYEANGKPIKEIKADLFGPKGIYIYDDKLYISDTGHHTIKIVNLKDESIGKYGDKGEGENELHEPTGLTIDDKGNKYIIDSRNNRIVKIDSNNKPVKNWHIKGWKDKESGKESWISYYKGKLYLSDPVLNRVRVFNTDGKELDILIEKLDRPAGLVIVNDKIYVVNDRNVIIKDLN